MAQEQAPWIVAENERPGTSSWRIPPSAPTSIAGFADAVSAQVGDTVTLYVSTPADAFHVEAYRIGYYGGTGGRLVWRSRSLHGHDQGGPIRTGGTNMIEAPWSPSARVHIGRTWPQGIYVLKLVGSNGAQSYVPLTLRDDASHAALVIQNSVTTWQAYNDWGGYSLYHGPAARSAPVRVSCRSIGHTSPGGAPVICSGSSRRSCTSPSGWDSTSRTGRTSTCTNGRGC